MTTAEKLLVQIFETKSRIIEQVKQQTESYNRHLASKALLHGVAPPSWLFNPHNSLSKELSKEDLISELLPPGPSSRPPVRYSVAGSSQYSKPFITDFREVSAGFGTEAHTSNKDGPDVVERQSSIVEGRECVDRNTSNYLPELDVSSPVDVVDVRISNIYTDPDRSLARIQRSKSRQKAIEQRNSATRQAKRNSGNEGTPRASSSGNRLFSLDYEQTGHINDSNIPAEPCALSNAKQSSCNLRDENNIGACSNEIKLKALGTEQVHSVSEPPRSAEPFSISSEGCRVKGKCETDNENLGEGYNDDAGLVSMSKRSGKSCSLQKPTLRNAEAEDKESNILNKFSVTSRDIVEINGGIGSSNGDDCSNEKGVISHAGSSTRSKCSGKTCEDTASKKVESGMEVKRSDAYVKKSSTPKRPPQQENHSSDFMEENYFSEFVSGKGVDNISSGNDPESYNNQICSFDGSLEQSCLEDGSGNRIIPPTTRQEVSDIRESDLEGGQPQNVNDPNFLKLSSSNKASLPDENYYLQTMGSGPNEELLCNSMQQLVDNEILVAVKKSDRSVHERSEDSPLNSQTLEADRSVHKRSGDSPLNLQTLGAASKLLSADRSFTEFHGSAEKKSIYKDSQIQIASGDHVKLRFSDMCDKAEQQESVNKIETIEPGTVKLAETFHVSEEGERREKSMGNSCSPLPGAAVSIPGGSFTPNKSLGSEPRRSWHYELDTPTTRSNPWNTFDDDLFSSKQGSAGEKSIYENSQYQRGSGDHGKVPSLDIRDKTEQLEFVDKVEAIELGTVKLAETFHVSEEGERREKSLGNSCSPFLDAALDVPRDSFIGSSGVQMTKSEPRRSWHYELEGHRNKGQHSPLNAAGSIRLTSVKKTFSLSSPLNTIDDVQFSSEQGCEFLSELLVEEGSAGEKSTYDDSQFQIALGDHVMLPFSDMSDKAEQLESVNKIEAIEPGTLKLAETFHVSEVDEHKEQLSGILCSPFPDAKAADVPRDSVTTNEVRDSGVQMTKSEPRRSCHYELEGHRNKGQHSPLNEAGSTRLTSVKKTFSLSSPLNTIDDVQVSSEQGCEFLSELLVEEGSAGEKSTYDDSQYQIALGDHVMLPFSDMSDKAEQLESVNKIEAIEPGTLKLAETFHVSEVDEPREQLSGTLCSPFPDAKAADVPRDSLTTNEVGDSGVQMTKSEPRRSCYYELEAHQSNGQHSPPNEAASRRSNPLNAIDDVKFSSEQRCGSSLELQIEEEKCHSTKNYENIVNYSQEMSEASIRSRWTEKAAESTLGGLFEGRNPLCLSSVYATYREDEQTSDIKSGGCPLGIEKLSCSDRISSEGRSSLQVDGPQPQHSDPCPRNKDLELMIDGRGNQHKSFREDDYSKRKSVVGEDGILAQSVQSTHMEELCAKDADKSLPELELFLIDSQSENETIFDDLELPKSTIARVSMLERLCKSASAYRPLSHLSSAFKMDEVSDLFHSLPNGLLEHTDLGGIHFWNKDDELQGSLSTPSEDEGGIQGVPLTNNLPPSGAPIDFSAVNGFSSPEGRFWEGGYSSRSNSSGKRLSSNPEFECFTIKEDPCVSEENESADDDSDELSKHVDSLTVKSHAIEPSTEIHNKFKSFICSSHKKKGMGKDSQAPLLVASGKRMAKESLNNTSKKLKTSGKPSLRNERLNRTREPYGSNIVSNVTSFIPLVQQKQAAAKACPAKREIKVKALEAAEAAKRLEEKRENDRKLKKEALQKERARTMEQEKAKQIELVRKKKEDEQRRKDADMLLKKRLREEEDRKEERKRTRTEEAQRKQRDQEEKLRSKKAGNMDSKRKSSHELKQGKKPGEQVKLDNKSRPAATSSSYIQKAITCPKECSYSADLCDNKQVNCTPDKAKTSHFSRDNIQEKSYEISPYHCSDDEDDEDDELHTKKFIPAWASKNLVAESLSLMREVDPSVIFPPESRCSLDEVLLPRTLQKVQSML